jgi:L-aminopeptidase/D-esterase-like protein
MTGTGPRNSITDVEGVTVGQYQRIGDGWATGTTVVLCPTGATGGVDGRGGAPGTRETDLLKPENMVQQVHAVCLSGGSAYGLAAADGVMRWLADREHGLPVGALPHEVVPIVPAAVLFDLPRSAWGNRPDADFGYQACENAGVDVALGCVGAGTGATSGGLKGGIGTASAITPSGYTVGALAAVNSFGQAVDQSTGRLFGFESEVDGEFGVTVPGRAVRLPATASQLNTTIGVVATNAALSKADCKRVAMGAQDGLVRATNPAHSMFDGDTVFALATGERTADGPVVLDELTAAAAETFTRALIHGVVAATSLAGAPSYRDLWPEA